MQILNSSLAKLTRFENPEDGNSKLLRKVSNIFTNLHRVTSRKSVLFTVLRENCKFHKEKKIDTLNEELRLFLQ
jgi:hypothetical protein